jgi:phosphoenolpyruvate-protein kinase (PTS system EI component)
MDDGLGEKSMKSTEVKRRATWKKDVSVFILGFVIGAVVVVQPTAKSIEQFENKVATLEKDKKDLEENIQVLQKEAETLQKEARSGPEKILKVSVHILNDIDDFAETRMTEMIKGELSYLIDQPVDKVASLPQAIYNSLHLREFQVNDREFAIYVQFFSIAKETQFFIKLRTPQPTWLPE